MSASYEKVNPISGITMINGRWKALDANLQGQLTKRIKLQSRQKQWLTWHWLWCLWNFWDYWHKQPKHGKWCHSYTRFTIL